MRRSRLNKSLLLYVAVILVYASLMMALSEAGGPHRMALHRAGLVLRVAFFPLAAAYGITIVLLAPRLRRRPLARRPAVPFPQIYREHFASLPYPEETVERVWKELAADLRVDPERLRPADRWDEELTAGPFPFAFVCEDEEDWRFEDRVELAEFAGADLKPLEKTKCEDVGSYVELSCLLESLARKKSDPDGS